MLFMYIHTHSVEKCLADKPEQSRQISAQLQEATKRAGVKVISNYVAPHEHTVFTIFEADNLAALEQAIIPMTTWGSARMIPIISLEQLLSQP